MESRAQSSPPAKGKRKGRQEAAHNKLRNDQGQFLRGEARRTYTAASAPPATPGGVATGREKNMLGKRQSNLTMGCRRLTAVRFTTASTAYMLISPEPRAYMLFVCSAETGADRMSRAIDMP